MPDAAEITAHLERADLLVAPSNRSSPLCADCGKDRGGKGGAGRCSTCYRRARARIRKHALVVAFGGRCHLCEIVVPHAAFDFHHVGDRNFHLSGAQLGDRSVKELADEAASCVMLCANCHRITHRS